MCIYMNIRDTHQQLGINLTHGRRQEDVSTARRARRLNNENIAAAAAVALHIRGQLRTLCR